MLININLDAEATQTALLDGLEVWLKLGLLSDPQVRQLCQDYLTVPLRPIPAQNVSRSPASEPDFILEPEPSARRRDRSPAQPAPARPTSPRPPARLAPRVLQSFLAEISVIWLLFLGVFMVVISSGVLAASQWRNFSPVGQYGILLAYTLAFWGTSLWTVRQPRLRLTARMLSIATLLIIPVNFWMMDGLDVWRSAIGFVVTAIASLVLSALTLNLLRSSVGLPLPPSPRLTAINAIALSWLHWGWDWQVFPLVAAYIGTVGTAFCLTRQFNQPNSSQTRLAAGEATQTPLPNSLSLGAIAIAFSNLLLLGRAVFAAQVPLSQLGLAFGICGWLLCWLSRPTLNRVIWNRVGAGLLLWGWLVSVAQEPPWQAIVISCLGLWLLWDQLKINWHRWQLTALLLVGFQAFWLLWFVLPAGWRQALISSIETGIGYPIDAIQLASVGWFPYVVLMVWVASRLRHWQQPNLAKHTEVLALILGAVLTSLGLGVPLLRSLNLLFSALTLTGVLRSRATPGPALIYLTHTAWLTTLIVWLDVCFPSLDSISWAAIMLGVMTAEWSLSIGSSYSTWRRSAWHLGLVVAVLAYLLLTSSVIAGDWGLLWLIAPAMLTVLASRRVTHSQLAGWLTIPALLVQAPLLNSLNAWTIALGVAATLMLINSFWLRQVLTAALTVGFALGFIGTLIWNLFAEQLTGEILLNLMAIAPLTLWVLWSWLNRRNTSLSTIYAAAANGWAIVLWVLIVGILVLIDLAFTVSLNNFPWEFLAAAIISTVAVGYRTWQRPADPGFWAVAAGVEICVASGMILTGSSLTYFAIATLALGMLTQLAGDWWISLSREAYRSSWHGIPLTYAVFGLILAHHTFTAYTGLYTLAAALIGINVSRRQTFLQPLTYLFLIVVSVAAYELLIYQLLQAPAGATGDGITLLAGLAAIIAVSDRLFSRWLLPYLRIPSAGLQTIGHLHWTAGTALLPLALISGLSTAGSSLWIGVAVILAGYALVMGNWRWSGEVGRGGDGESGEDREGRGDGGGRYEAFDLVLQPTFEVWTYAGIVEAIAAVAYGFYRLIPNASLLVAWGAVIACGLAIVMHSLPWSVWGWSIRPWRQSAALLPAMVVLCTSWEIALQALLLVAAFYAWLARAREQIRLSYISILLLDWAILRFINAYGEMQPIWSSLVIGGSLLYVAQIDPSLQTPDERDKRHLLRTLATGLICVTALYQAEVETQAAAIFFAVLTLILSLGLILTGLVLRVRAFLYVGTATFIIRVLRLLWLFINTYSLLLWAVGIVLGLIFIWIAATFEARRTQVTAFVQYWLAELDEWE